MNRIDDAANTVVPWLDKQQYVTNLDYRSYADARLHGHTQARSLEAWQNGHDDAPTDAGTRAPTLPQPPAPVAVPVRPRGASPTVVSSNLPALPAAAAQASVSLDPRLTQYRRDFQQAFLQVRSLDAADFERRADSFVEEIVDSGKFGPDADASPHL